MTNQAASNPTRMIGQFLGSDETLLRRRSNDISLRYLFIRDEKEKDRRGGKEQRKRKRRKRDEGRERGREGVEGE